MIQITQNSISSHTTGVNIMKSPWRNPVHQGLSNNTKGAVQCPLKKFSFDFVEFFWQNYSIFNNSCTTCLNNMEPISAHSYSSRRVCEMGGTTVWQSSTGQTNYLP
jgi:hypothetical protein